LVENAKKARGVPLGRLDEWQMKSQVPDVVSYIINQKYIFKEPG